MRSGPFVVTVASEKGGVGKTTIATNLAVYLKALREDLPVTIASFDNHFSIDQMFAIGRHRGGSVAGLFAGRPAAELAGLGEYGVQFLASEREMIPPDDDPLHLRRAVASSGLPGLLILDTRPILDYFTRNALLAADLVLVPVKDRASLVNAASLQRVLAAGDEGSERLWLLPSLVDARLRLRRDIGIREYLLYAARERGYQVLDTWIAKSPKVEGLATGFSARIRPVLTDARTTVVHQQFRDLASFVLQRFDASPPGSFRWEGKGLARRESGLCPICTLETGGEEVLTIEDLRRRQQGHLHAACLGGLLEETELFPFEPSGAWLLLQVEGGGVSGAEPQLSVHLLGRTGSELASCRLPDISETPLAVFLQEVTGRHLAELYREVFLVSLQGGVLPKGMRRELMEEFWRR